MKIYVLTKNMYTNVHRRFIHNRQKLETTQMSFNRRMVKWCTVVNPYHGYYSAIKRQELLIVNTHSNWGVSLGNHAE